MWNVFPNKFLIFETGGKKRQGERGVINFGRVCFLRGRGLRWRICIYSAKLEQQVALPALVGTYQLITLSSTP